MVIEVKVNIIGELITRTSKLRKGKKEKGEKPTSEGQRRLIHPANSRNDGK